MHTLHWIGYSFELYCTQIYWNECSVKTNKISLFLIASCSLQIIILLLKTEDWFWYINFRGTVTVIGKLTLGIITLGKSSTIKEYIFLWFLLMYLIFLSYWRIVPTEAEPVSQLSVLIIQIFQKNVEGE